MAVVCGGFGRSWDSVSPLLVLPSWAPHFHMRQGVVPDIVTMGKPIGNGFPLAAVVITLLLTQCVSAPPPDMAGKCPVFGPGSSIEWLSDRLGFLEVEEMPLEWGGTWQFVLRKFAPPPSQGRWVPLAGRAFSIHRGAGAENFREGEFGLVGRHQDSPWWGVCCGQAQSTPCNKVPPAWSVRNGLAGDAACHRRVVR